MPGDQVAMCAWNESRVLTVSLWLLGPAMDQ